MKRYILNPTINEISDVKSITRDGSGGFTVSTTSSDKTSYNDPNLYINRALDVIAGSTEQNTLITNDGIVAIFRGEDILEVYDLFEEETTTYEGIEPKGFLELSNYTEDTNPINKRVFIINTDESDNIIINNSLQFIENGSYHFRSELDYDLNTDEYGFYITDETDWNSTYSATTQFQILKKPFLKLDTDATISVFSIINVDEVEKSDLSNNLYSFKYLNTDESNKYLKFTLTADAAHHGYLIIY